MNMEVECPNCYKLAVMDAEEDCISISCEQCGTIFEYELVQKDTVGVIK